MEALQDIVSVELKDEYLLAMQQSSYATRRERKIPIAKMNDPIADDYRSELAGKYGRKR
ncbi:hypothetical protein [Paenibacillus sp. GCM10028914]|uniref:hypothetical protein n=1 Tax=Paenibacillus sp. GCM10028914 TaxID=3273416 RepID=UPI00360FE1BC